ncbi:hypothetical protein GCM10022225_44880 [Plantactinospora mayteni]|uniref:Uncharacterized protein n=2 Tax=Plantactinospora mayteni TaxID=566021 RepID=A0ABQ4EXQ0_9ACTN|nr:hypothetical protein Pma05_60070 [Plantactinospora mayteni]
MAATDIRSMAVLRLDDRTEPAPSELVEAMVRFEVRYGGLWYPAVGPNGMEYGLDGDATVHRSPLGLAFTGIMDGARTSGIDILADGQTAWGPGRWSYRVIDRSVDQRLESHALLVAVSDWCHRTFTCYTPRDVNPVVDERRLPQPVSEATSPTEFWWLDDDADIAVQARLSAWPPERDEWTLRYFARTPAQAAEANPTVFGATVHETVPALWCTLCSQLIEPGRTCHRKRGR